MGSETTKSMEMRGELGTPSIHPENPKKTPKPPKTRQKHENPKKNRARAREVGAQLTRQSEAKNKQGFGVFPSETPPQNLGRFLPENPKTKN